jgi:hypothetical protein
MSQEQVVHHVDRPSPGIPNCSLEIRNRGVVPGALDDQYLSIARRYDMLVRPNPLGIPSVVPNDHSE